MPLYSYEAEDAKKSCEYCRNGFTIAQSLKDEKLAHCPQCGAPVAKVIKAPALRHSQTDLHYRAKRAGFTALKRVDKGTYEKMY
ncbi:MAG: zinc ribbon domain-containing protein [Kiritimatiellae bacterium]|nr:zinc ribbon domain-containing protein [Kiritimatiellia bacterium]